MSADAVINLGSAQLDSRSERRCPLSSVASGDKNICIYLMHANLKAGDGTVAVPCAGHRRTTPRILSRGAAGHSRRERFADRDRLADISKGLTRCLSRAVTVSASRDDGGFWRERRSCCVSVRSYPCPRFSPRATKTKFVGMDAGNVADASRVLKYLRRDVQANAPLTSALHRADCRSDACRRVWLGMQKANVAPGPSLASAQMHPSWLATIEGHIESPTPRPFVLVV
jgi:hypothetical protein